jgi:hypothetical protein
MKKALLLTAILITACLYSFAQTVNYPRVGIMDSPGSLITKIETDKQYTIVSFEQYALSDSSWMVLNKEIYIQTDVSNKHYEFVKAEGIAIEPETKTIITRAGNKHLFKIYFKKIPSTAKLIDIIEHAGKRSDGITFFNFYNVDLTNSNTVEEHVKVTEVVLPPPPVNGQFNATGANEFTNMMGAMGPMYASLITSMLDAQLSFYKQPGKLTEVAKLHKQYFDALVKAGFNYEQAIRILTSAPLIQMTSSSGK